MRGLRHRQRRNGRPTPLDLLLGDPGTVYAAADAFALVERPNAAAWPVVASVGPRTVTLRWAGVASTVPEPEAPWRVGHDARVWIADRDEIGVDGPVAGETDLTSVVAIGQFQESVVFVNTSRAPGPIVVGGGSGGAAGLLHELLTRQMSGDDRRGAWWPVEVEGDAVVLLGLAIARMFTADEVRLACELMERARVQEREHRRTPAAVERAPEPSQPPAPEPTEPPAPEPPQPSAPEPTEPPAPEPAQPPAPQHTPAPAEEDLDDWAAGFAVSSRTSSEPAN
jgi:hypothetical protein